MKKLDLGMGIGETVKTPVVARHPVYLSDDFIAGFVKFYEENEGGRCQWDHHTTLGSEDLSLRIMDDDSEQEFQVRVASRTRLVVRRVFLKNRRQGIFSYMVLMILETLKDGPVVDFEVESVLTPEMQAWCLKHEVEPIKGMMYSEEGLGGSYRCSVKRLHSNLRYSLGHKLNHSF